MKTSKLEPGTGRIAFAVTLTVAFAVPSMAATYTVGSDPACTHSTISAALLAAAFNADPDTIILARNQSYTDEFVHLTNFGPTGSGELTIAGGYSTCSSSTSLGHTEIDGRADQSTFEIDTTGASQSEVTLRNLKIVGSAIRGVKVEGNTTVSLEGSIIEANGGGIDVEPGAVVDVDFYTTVLNNRGGFGQGGGIRCWGGIVNFSGVVLDNLATAGGGIYAGNGCYLLLTDGALVVSNDATNGGGLFVELSSTVNAGVIADVDERISVEFNTALDRGGGIYASGPFTGVFLFDVNVDDNQAVNRGGGIFTNEARVVLANTPDCKNRVRCTTLSRNSLSFGNIGAALAAVSAQVDVGRAYIEGNIAQAGTLSSVFYAIGANTTLHFASVAFWDNQGADALFVGDADATIVADFVSASGNTDTGGSPARPATLFGAATAELTSSIFWPNSPVLEAGGTVSLANCLIVSDPSGLPAGGLVSTVDPLFRDAAGGNLHLRNDSPAVDYCDQPTLTVDVELDPRPFDLPGNPNGSPGVPGGTYDIGFDEVSHLFADGFESGDTSAWSSSTLPTGP